MGVCGASRPVSGLIKDYERESAPSFAKMRLAEIRLDSSGDSFASLSPTPDAYVSVRDSTTVPRYSIGALTKHVRLDPLPGWRLPADVQH